MSSDKSYLFKGLIFYLKGRQREKEKERERERGKEGGEEKEKGG